MGRRGHDIHDQTEVFVNEIGVLATSGSEGN